MYLFFKVSWTAPVLPDWHSLPLDNGSSPKFGPEGQQQEGTVVGWELGACSGMGLWELNLGSWTVQLAGRSLACSVCCGLHLSSESLLKLGYGHKAMGGDGGGIGWQGSGLGIKELNPGSWGSSMGRKAPHLFF